MTDTTSDPFHNYTACPWCTGPSRHATSDDWEQAHHRHARYCERCRLVFTRNAKREWDDPFFNPTLKTTKGARHDPG